MKKVILFLGAATLLVGATACGGSKNDNKSSDSSEFELSTTDDSSTEYSSSTESDDKSGYESDENGSIDYSMDDVRREAHENVDRAHEMINEELDKHGALGKAAKHLYDESANEMHKAIDEASSSDDDDD